MTSPLYEAFHLYSGSAHPPQKQVAQLYWHVHNGRVSYSRLLDLICRLLYWLKIHCLCSTIPVQLHLSEFQCFASVRIVVQLLVSKLISIDINLISAWFLGSVPPEMSPHFVGKSVDRVYTHSWWTLHVPEPSYFPPQMWQWIKSAFATSRLRYQYGDESAGTGRSSRQMTSFEDRKV